jgi:membrane-associated phospholipid phosphatase
MAAISPVDYEWTVYLIEHRWDPAVTFLRRTVFEGSAVGATDLPIFSLLILIVLYVWASRSRAKSQAVLLRPWLGFGLVSTLAAGLGAVHTLKWILGRARPYEVVAGDHLPFTPWYWPGPHFITEGIYRGSFPSGHTAAAFALIALAYALAGDPLLSRGWRLTGWFVGAGSLLFSAAMTVASSMARSHWLSDAVGATGFVWIVVHVLYYWGLRIPEQRRYWAAHAALPPLPGRWEARFCGLGLLALLGVIAMGFGLRALVLQPVPYLSVLVPIGAGAVAIFAPRAWSILARLRFLLRERKVAA